jgi:hypothetical protein
MVAQRRKPPGIAGMPPSTPFSATGLPPKLAQVLTEKLEYQGPARRLRVRTLENDLLKA